MAVFVWDVLSENTEVVILERDVEMETSSMNIFQWTMQSVKSLTRLMTSQFSMKAMDYLQMPTLISTKKSVHLTNAEAKRYKEFKKESVISDSNEIEVTAANAASLSNKLVQMAMVQFILMIIKLSSYMIKNLMHLKILLKPQMENQFWSLIGSSMIYFVFKND